MASYCRAAHLLSFAFHSGSPLQFLHSAVVPVIHFGVASVSFRCRLGVDSVSSRSSFAIRYEAQYIRTFQSGLPLWPLITERLTSTVSHYTAVRRYSFAFRSGSPSRYSFTVHSGPPLQRRIAERPAATVAHCTAALSYSFKVKVIVHLIRNRSIRNLDHSSSTTQRFAATVSE